MSVSEKPPEPDSSPSGEPEAEVDTGEPKTPASGKSPSLAPTPKVHVAPPAEGSDEPWSFEMGEVLDLGVKGRFTVKDRLGRGGIGEVYRADCATALMSEPVKTFALKVVRPDAGAYWQRIFRDEVRLLSQLRHESIARYHT